MLLNDHWSMIAGFVLLAAVLVFLVLLQKPKVPKSALPPLVSLSAYELQHTPIKSITKALKQYGSIIQIDRNGHRIFLTSKEHTHQILTDERSFSFESGMAKFFGLTWINKLHDGTFFHDMDTYARGFVAQRMQKVVPEIWPIFDQRVREMVEISQPGKPVELQHHVQAIMAEATICIFFGQGYANSKNVKSVVDLAEDIAELLGIYQNQSFLGRNLFWLWKPLTWARIVLFRIPLHIGFTFARTLWTDISDMAESPEKKDDSLVSYLVRAYASPGGHLSIRTRMWIMVLILTFLFASLHQTATIMIWVTYHLALHPEYQNYLRDEASSIVNSGEMNYSNPIVDVQTIQNAVKTDSFIREVLRMKGDLVNLVRAPVRDIELGGYIVPKGSLVFPVTHLSYRSPEFVNEPDKFNGDRWVGSGKSAAMTGPGYLAFGLGRWACPGRLLAVTELKCWIFALLKYSKVELDSGKYEILDPFNITSVPPRGDIMIERWKSYV